MAELEQVIGKVKGAPTKEGEGGICNSVFANGKDEFSVTVFRRRRRETEDPGQESRREILTRRHKGGTMHHQASTSFRFWNTRGILMPVGLVALAASITMAWADQPPPTITLDLALHFTGADGQDLVVGPGAYRVDTHEAHIRLTPEDGKESLLIEASAAQHGETVTAPVAMIVAEDGQEDQNHLVLLLPDAKELEAVGSLSGTTSRATSFSRLSRTQMQQAYAQQRQSVETPNRFQPIKAAPAVAPPPAAPAVAETTETVQVGRQVTWSFLAMRHPGMVAEALAAVQTGKQPRESLAGLAFSDAELNEMMKTDWSAAVTRFDAMRSAAVTQPGVTPRGLSLADQAKLAPSATASLPPSAIAIAPVRFPIATRDLGSVWAGQQATTVISLLAPADGYIQARLDMNATRRHFRILHARSYTGEVVNGGLVIAQLIPGGQYHEVIHDPADPQKQISKAGFATILLRKGQQVDFTIVFDPVGLGMTPVGENEASLELSAPLSQDVSILSPSTPSPMWKRTASIRARFEGINFGVIAQMEQASITTFVMSYVPDKPLSLEAALLLTNTEQRPWSVTISPTAFDPHLHMAPFTVSLGPGEKRRIPLPLQIDGGALSISERRGAIRYAYGNIVRQVGFGVTYYLGYHAWHSGSPSDPSLDVGSCETSWDIYIRSDGTTRMGWTLRNNNLFVPMRMFIDFYLLDKRIGRGTLSDGQNTIHTKMNSTTIRHEFVAENYVRLLTAPARVKIECRVR